MKINAAQRWNIRMLSWPYWAFAFAVVIFSFFKIGFTIRPLNPDPLSTFPTPQPTWSALSYGMRTLTWLGGWEYPSAYTLLSVAITVASIVAIIYFSKSFMSGEDSRIAILLLLTSPIAVVLYNNQGRHDALMILGSILLGFLGRKTWLAAIAAAVMIAANPEQALLSAGILLACSFTPTFQAWRRGALVALVMSTVSFLALSIWAQASGVGSRLTYIRSLFGDSIYGFFSNFSLSIYAGFGILWVLVVYLLVHQNRKQKMITLIALAVIPFAITMITLDQTRVFVGVTAATLVALVLQLTPLIRAELHTSGHPNVIFWTFIAAVLLPSFEVSVDHVVRPPFLWFFAEVLPHIQQAIGLS